jgi:hypothetical protein
LLIYVTASGRPARLTTSIVGFTEENPHECKSENATSGDVRDQLRVADKWQASMREQQPCLGHGKIANRSRGKQHDPNLYYPTK